MDGDIVDKILEESVAETTGTSDKSEVETVENVIVTESSAASIKSTITTKEAELTNVVLEEKQTTENSETELLTDLAPEFQLTKGDVLEKEEAVVDDKKSEETMDVSQEREQTLEGVLEKDAESAGLEPLHEEHMDVTESLDVSEKVIEQDVLLTPVVENTTEVQASDMQEKIANDVGSNFIEQPQTEISDTIMDKLEQLPDNFNVASDVAEPMSEITGSTNSGSLQESTDILHEAAKKIEPNKWKPKSGAFSLGVPGLSFSAQNLKISSDGTKMIQIHQSQITSTQLEALQANPNIKVVFRHIPSGKSFTKPPKNLFKKKSTPKPAPVPLENGEIDDSVYNFDDLDDSSTRDKHNKKLLSNDYNPNRYARYNPNVGFKKKPGRPAHQHANADGSKPVLPAQIQLTDALVKLNKPGAVNTIKVHVKQVTHDILINMELNPKYNIVLTAKHEKLPEHSLEELVKEWEEKETMKLSQENQSKEVAKKPQSEKEATAESKEDTPEFSKPIEKDVEEVKDAVVAVSDEPQSPFTMPEPKKAKKDPEEVARLKEVKMKQLVAEEEILSASLKETTSRSGRIRKPSRFSLDIARMTKRRAVDSDSNDSPAPKKIRISQTPPSANKASETTIKKGRGRPSKKSKQSKKSDDPTPEESNEEKTKDVDKETLQKSPLPNEPRVLLSPIDKQMADKKMFGKKSAAKDEEINVSEISHSSKSTPEKAKDKVRSSPSPKKSDPSPQKKNESSAAAVATPTATEDLELPDLAKRKKPERQSPARPTTSSISSAEDKETPSDILARKLSKEDDGSGSEKVDTGTTALKDFVEEEGDVDNKYRLRKLLQQCSIEEIRSVAMPKALDIISLGDFFTFKAGQMSNKKVSFTALYQQLENFYSSMERESMRYSTLLRRANKVGGDRRMEKVILMPVYNKSAAESLNLSSTSVDAHIGGIYQKPTTPMIAANSFHMNCKMDPPVHRLKLPDISEKSYGRNKHSYDVNTNVSNQQAQLNFLSSQRDVRSGRGRGSWKKGISTRKPDFLSDEVQGQTSMTIQEHARLQAASRYQPIKQATTVAQTPSSLILQPEVKTQGEDEKAAVSLPPTTETVQLSAINAEASGQVMGESVAAEEGATIVQAEDGKQLVSIGDGQYVELPEGYTLIQTDEGYIIGQPGATFVQGEDGNVYMTSTEEGTTEISAHDQVLAKTVVMTDGETAEEQVMEHSAQS